VRVHIQTVRGAVALDAEIASGRGNQLRGLMGRTRLPPDAGMLFIYHHAQAPDAGFWMFRTHLPLDIAFLDAEGRIFAIHAMVPCVSLLPWRCPTYAPDAPYWAALEVNRGFFARHSIYVGDQVVLPAVRSSVTRKGRQRSRLPL
jgi:hypothetical protein